MKRHALLWAYVALLAWAASPAGASPQSQALAARALIEIEQGRTDEAMELLDRAVAADPKDAGVRYQRGTMRAQRGDYSGAIVDLRAALAERPYFPQASLELGAALNESGDSRGAVPRLQEAQNDPALEAQASFFLGVAQLRLEQLDEAKESFARALRLDPSLQVSTDYYLGVIAFRGQDFGTAETRFAAVEEADPSSMIGLEATRFRELIRRSRGDAFRFFGSVSLEYDSNVTLASSTTPPTTVPGAISGEADGRYAVSAGGVYVPWRTGPFQLAMSYQFFQSLHFKLSDYNLQDNRPTVQLTAQRGTVTYGLQGRYDYYLLKTDSYMQEVTAYPWISVREPGINGRTDLYYRMQWRDFKKLNFDVLNGYYHFTGVRQIIDLGAHGEQLWVGYEYGFVNPVNGGSDQFEFNSQQADAGIRWPLPFEVTAETGYRFEYQGYDDASGDLYLPHRGPRKDYDHRVIVSFERPLTPHLTGVASYFGTFNNSNQDAFQYDRQIGSIGVEMSF